MIVLNRTTFAVCACAAALSVASTLPAAAQTAPVSAPKLPPVADPDAPNAPIPDRETASVAPKQARPAPGLREIGVTPTRYPIPKNALFASPDGDEQASGSDRARPTTLAHAVTVAPTGWTIVLRGGDYRGVRALKLTRPLTIQPLPGETVWIKGSDIVTGFQPEGTRWSVAWDKKLTHPNAADMDKNNPLAMDTDMLFLAGKSLRQVATVDEVTPGTFCVDTTAKRLIVGSDPTGKMVEATVAVTGLDIKGKETWGTVIRGLGFAHYAERAVEAFTRNLLLENNTFAWNAVRGLSLHDADNVLRGNTFACNGLSGMACFYTDRLLFENNQVLFNNIEGFRATWSAAGTKFAISKNMTLRNNLYENNQAAALWLDISCIKTQVIGNTVRHNKGLGIFFELAHDGVAAFNVCEDNGVGLMLSDASSIRVWNNTFLDNAKAVVVKDTPRVNNGKPESNFYGPQKTADLALGATWIAADNEFHNNLFAGGRDKKTVLFDATPAAKDHSSADMIVRLDHNAYAQTGANPARIFLRWSQNGKPTDFVSLADFRAANAAYESWPLVLTTVPFAASGDYHLMPRSPLASAGAALPGEVKAAAAAAGIGLPEGGVPIGAKGAAAR